MKRPLFHRLLAQFPKARPGLPSLPESAGAIDDALREKYCNAFLEACCGEDWRGIAFYKRAYHAYGDALIDDATCYTAARRAVQGNQFSLLQLIVDMVPIEKLYHPKHGHAFGEAVLEGNLAALEILWDAGLGVDARLKANQPFSETAFSMAAHHNAFPMMEALAARGAKLDLCYEAAGNRTLLCWATQECYFATASKLLALGANPDVPDNRGNVAAQYIRDTTPPELAHALLEKTHSINAPNSEGRTIGMTLSGVPEPCLLTAPSLSRVDWHAVDHSGWNAAHYAADAGAVLNLRWLHDWGVTIDLPDAKDRTPLHFAVNNNHWMTACILAGELGADVHLPDPETGRRALETLLLRLYEHRQSNYSQFAYLATLLECGADVLVPDGEGKNALDRIPDFIAPIDKGGAITHRGAHYTRTRLSEWQEKCRDRWLTFTTESFAVDLMRNGQPTAMVRQLAGAGLLQEAFAPGRWQGRLEEGKQTIETLLPLLPDFQRARYRHSIDRTAFVTQQPITESFSTRVKNLSLKPPQR